MSIIIFGSQWGGEGKGKLTDILCSQANSVSCDFHLLPWGLVAPGCINLIGSGVVFHVPSFFKELADIEAKGIKDARSRILVSDRCHINFDLHAAADGLEEIELGKNAVGTTKRVIGPCYSTKASRSGIRLAVMFDKELFNRKLRQLEVGYKKRYGDLVTYDIEEEIKRFDDYRVKLQDYLVDALEFMVHPARETNKKILVEESQALLLNLHWGTYPYATSSNTCLGGMVSGLALKRRNTKGIVRVVKAYATRVGSGPSSTEDHSEVGSSLQKLGGKVGVSAGCTQRCGWLDLVVLKYSCAINDYDALTLSKLNVLDTFEKPKIAVAYKDPQTGEKMQSFPADSTLQERVEVVYDEVPDWKTSTSKTRQWSELPMEARDYVEYIEKFVGCKVKWIGTGPDRDDMVVR